MPLDTVFTLVLRMLAGICETSPLLICQAPPPSLPSKIKQSQSFIYFFPLPFTRSELALGVFND